MACNFFLKKYRREPEKTDVLLGICDPKGEQCAYTTKDSNCPDRWCAWIKNTIRKRIVFIPIDKNMDIRRPNGEKEKLCDGMIYGIDTRELSFVELKEYHTGGYLGEAVEQLESTLQVFLVSHNYQDFFNRKAYVCNPVRPNFKSSYREISSEFRKKYKFRLLTQADIIF